MVCNVMALFAETPSIMLRYSVYKYCCVIFCKERDKATEAFDVLTFCLCPILLDG